MRRWSLGAVVFLLALPCTLHADGTLMTSALLDDLARSNPKLVQTLRQGFELDKDAEGDTVGRAVNPKLGGARIGPYTVRGRLKGETGAMHLQITLDTDVVFYDKNGHVTSNVSDAVRIKEVLSSVNFTEASAMAVR
jgi:hypothetical protein